MAFIFSTVFPCTEIKHSGDFKLRKGFIGISFCVSYSEAFIIDFRVGIKTKVKQELHV